MADVASLLVPHAIYVMSLCCGVGHAVSAVACDASVTSIFENFLAEVLRNGGKM